MNRAGSWSHVPLPPLARCSASTSLAGSPTHANSLLSRVRMAVLPDPGAPVRMKRPETEVYPTHGAYATARLVSSPNVARTRSTHKELCWRIEGWAGRGLAVMGECSRKSPKHDWFDTRLRGDQGEHAYALSRVGVTGADGQSASDRRAASRTRWDSSSPCASVIFPDRRCTRKERYPPITTVGMLDQQTPPTKMNTRPRRMLTHSPEPGCRFRPEAPSTYGVEPQSPQMALSRGPASWRRRPRSPRRRRASTTPGRSLH
jgi:hypothetical protein